MNAVEIEEAISALASAPFDRAEFPFAFLAAFGNKETAIQRLRSGSTNQSDVPGGVLQRNNIHLAACAVGKVGETFTALRTSPKNTKGKPKFVLATDGVDVEAEELATGEVIACKFEQLGDAFGFFLPLAGISTVAEIKNNPIDIKATSRLNKLYVELLKENPDWGTAGRRQELNQLMARLIFCFFAEDTGIFNHQGMFTACIKQMTAPDSSNTHEVITELFRVMDTKPNERDAASVKKWAREFPYVNGGLFTHSVTCPRFTKHARSLLIRAGELDWKQINPDIFGSMIQAVADDDERGELGMHYTSVPNILKVLDPLFLDDLRDELDKAQDNPRKLLNLRKRIANIRVFDPACGSGNFLVIAYIKMREIEAEIVRRRGEKGDWEAQRTWMQLTNFYGIEIKSFAAEVARLSLLIAEFQCNVRLIGQREACLDVLPLHDTGRIHTGNALRMDWLEVCPPPQKAAVVEEDLGGPTGRLALDAKDTRVEIYICGNPPYVGRRNQTKLQKSEIQELLSKKIRSSASLDYVFCWLEKASDYLLSATGSFAFVTTNSVSQGSQVPIFWPYLLGKNLEINFAHRSFKWSNNASNNAGVTCVIIGVGHPRASKTIIDGESRYSVNKINPYLLPSEVQVVEARSTPISTVSLMSYGNLPGDGNWLTLDRAEREQLIEADPRLAKLVLKLFGAQEFIRGLERYCLWIDDADKAFASSFPFIADRIEKVRITRIDSKDPSYNDLADRPHQFRDRNVSERWAILAPTVSSEGRQYLPTTVFPGKITTTNQAFALYDAPIWNMALIASRLHLVWIATVCGKMKTDFRYSNTLGWNTFPVPTLTENQKADLTCCAEDILLAREHYWPATIAAMYDPERMESEFPLVRQAHEKNDETLERIYIGRRFKNDTERLEKLFDMYTKMTAAEAAKAPKKVGRKTKTTDESSPA